MEKTRIGIPAPFVAAAIYLSALFSGYLLTGLLVGYVLLCEKDRSLKTHAVCAFSLLLAFSLINCAVYLLPDMFDVVSDMLAVFNVYFYPSFISTFGSTRQTAKTISFPMPFTTVTTALRQITIARSVRFPPTAAKSST